MSHMSRPWNRSVVLAGALCLGLQGACSKAAHPPQVVKSAPVAAKSQPVAQPTANSERYLNFNNLGEPEYLDPGLMSGVREVNIAGSLFEGLFAYDAKTGAPVPAGAEKWSASADGKTYTFTLRKNAKWTDGTPVTAKDYMFAWERVLNPKTAAKYSFVYYYIQNAKEYNEGKITDASQLGFRALDDYTLEVTLAQPAPFFTGLLANPSYFPVPRQAVEKFGDKWTLPEHIVTNGAFALKSWVPYKEIVVAKSPTYWGAASVKLAGVRFLPIEDKETALKMYEAGEVDVSWEVPTTKAPSLMKRPDFVKAGYLANEYYQLNTAKPPLNDVRVRKALAMAIDRKTLVEKFLQGTEVVDPGFVPSGMQGYVVAQGPTYDPEGARKLFAEAGFADGSTFPVQTIHYDTRDENKIVAQIIQQMWKQNLGITTELFNEEWKTYLKTNNMRNFQITRTGWVGDYLDPNTFLDLMTSYSQQNNTNWANPTYDHLVENSLKELNATKRLAMLHDAEALLLAEMPIIPLFTKSKMMMVRENLKGFYANLMDQHAFKEMYFADEAAK